MIKMIREVPVSGVVGEEGRDRLLAQTMSKYGTDVGNNGHSQSKVAHLGSPAPAPGCQRHPDVTFQ